MLKKHASKVTILSFLFVMILTTPLAWAAPIGQFHGASRRVIYQTTVPEAPVRFIQISTAQRKVTSGESFSAASQDWLDGLQVEFENTSGRTIKCVEIDAIATVENTATPISFSLRYGSIPGFETGDSVQPLIPFDGKGVAYLSELDVNNLKGSLLKMKEIRLSLGPVYFDDDSATYAGSTLLPVGTGHWVVSPQPGVLPKTGIPLPETKGVVNCAYKLDSYRYEVCWCKSVITGEYGPGPMYRVDDLKFDPWNGKVKKISVDACLGSTCISTTADRLLFCGLDF